MPLAVLPSPERQVTPSLAKLRFLTDDPHKIWQECVALQNTWKQKLSAQEEYVNCMEKFKLVMVVKTIYTANVLEDTLPAGVSVNAARAEEALKKAYHKDAQELAHTGSESDHSQLLQHLQAFKHLCEPLPLLTEDLIKETHGIMMRGLKNEQGQSVNAGSYRTGSVMAGDHVFPPFTCVPSNMARIVKDYNEKSSRPHDFFELASWLHYNVVSLHPFKDGNGRISRLLWCYSLMRDGLPFPVVLTSGHKKSQKHLVQCLQRDRDRTCGKDDNPHMTTLTVISILQAWKQFSAHFKIDLA